MTRISFVVCLILGLASVCQSFDSINSGGYEITAGITQKGDRLELDGKVKSGPKCKKLFIRCSVLSTHGQGATISAVTNYSGSGSNIYDGKERVWVDRSRGLPSWNIIQTTANCYD